MIVLDSLFPVFTLIVLGVVLKRLNFTTDPFLKISDKLVYFIFFPAMLFWKIGGGTPISAINLNVCIAAICSVLTLYGVSTLYIVLFRVSAFQAGSFSQSCYRFNTYIGMAIVITALGEKGVTYFSVLIGLLIPMINVLAVSTLIWFSGHSYTPAQRIRITLKALISNPLIIACMTGIVYSRFDFPFPGFLDNTFRLTSLVTLPLALLSIGGALTGANLKGQFKLALAASVFKLLVLPLVGLFFLKAFNVTGISFKVAMIFFALPTSTAIYVLSAQLSSDTQLASASIVLSTVLSFGSLTAVLLI